MKEIGSEAMEAIPAGMASFSIDGASDTATGSNYGAGRGIAIIGIGCRLPGPAVDPHAFWEMLLQKTSAAGKVPANRFDVDKYHHLEKGRPGSIRAAGGYFLDGDPTLFEPSLFNINPNEAAKLDPSMRKLIEVVFETIESAGVPLEQLAGSDTGCYVGSFNHDELFSKVRDSPFADPYTATTAIAPFLSNRLSYIFDLHGPSMTVDTACSASFYALHLAFQAIANHEIESAIVASSNLIWSPDMQIFLDKLGALSPNSRCNVFGEDADGYARADGFVGFFLKDLTAAKRDRDPIHAVLRATAVNANGRTGGITHPSPIAQEAAMRKAYRSQPDLDPANTAYYECHGTGTAVGDPLELRGIQSFFSASRSQENPLLLGSVKSNIGHGEPVSGLSGLLKVTMAIKNGILPPMLMPKQISTKLNMDWEKFRLVSEAMKWPKHLPRRASVASSGFGGANAHVIVEELNQLENGAPKGLAEKAIQHYESDARLLMAFSAHKQDSLIANYDAIVGVSRLHDGFDLAYTLSNRRSRLLYRGFSTATQTKDECVMKKDDLKVATSVQLKAPKIGLVFTGQGAQWPQMGCGLFHRFDSFRRAIEKMTAALQKLPDKPSWTLVDILNAPAATSRVYEAEISQPACTALQVGLVDLIRSWNICPSASVGHSSGKASSALPTALEVFKSADGLVLGEMAAAYAAGLITAEEAIVAAYYRGKAVKKLTRKGCMLAVGCDIQTIEPHISNRKDDICIAAVNSPQSLTLSGEPEAVHKLEEALSKENIFNRVLATGDKAYHSSHMRDVGGTFEDSMNASGLQGIDRSSPSDSVPFYSSVFGHRCDNLKPDPSYWRRNLESPVLFQPAFEDLAGHDMDIVIEIGPHSALAGPIRQIEAPFRENSKKFPTYLPSLVRKREAEECMLELAGTLYNWGADIDIQAVNQIGDLTTSVVRLPSVITDLPTYRYVYQPPEYESNRPDREFRFPRFAFDDLIGNIIPGCSLSAPSWRNIIRKSSQPYTTALKHHGVSILPDSCFLAMVLQACKQVANFDKNADCPSVELASFEIDQVYFPKPLVLEEEQDVVLSMLEDSESPRVFSFVITSVSRDANERHCYGKVKISTADTNERAFGRTWVIPDNPITIPGSKWYQKLADGGLEFSDCWKKIESIGVSPQSGAIRCGEIRLSDSKDAMTMFEVALQMAAFSTAYQGQPRNLVPHRLSRIDKLYVDCVAGNSDVFEALAKYNPEVDSHGQVATTATTYNDAGKLVLRLGCASYLPFHKGGKSDHSEKFFQVVTKPDFAQHNPAGLQEIFPPPPFPDTETFDKVHILATAMVVQFCRSAPRKQISKFGSAGESFLEWLEKAYIRAQEDDLPSGRDITNLSSAETANLIEKIYEEISDESVEACLMMRMYRNLNGVIDGTASAHDLLIGDGLLGKLYTSKFTAMGSMCQLTRIIDLLGHKHPSARYIEIGGGTGGSTREILKVLEPTTGPKRYGQYHFTDVSSYFLSGAQQEFAHHANITYGTLDIEQLPKNQGIEVASFDIAVAANVLHATSSVEQTLKHVRSLLKDGGKLILVETTIETAWLTIVLGGFQDYWKGRRDGRPSSPFLPVDQWSKLLKSTGFTVPEIDLPDYGGTYQSMNVLVATAVSIPIEKQGEEFLQGYCEKVNGNVNGFQNGDTQLSTIERLYPISKTMLDEPEMVASRPTTDKYRDSNKTTVLIDLVRYTHFADLVTWLAQAGVTSIIIAESDHRTNLESRLQALKVIGNIQRLGVTAHLLPKVLDQVYPEDLQEIFSYLTTGIETIIFGPVNNKDCDHPTLQRSLTMMQRLCRGPLHPNKVIMFADARGYLSDQGASTDFGFAERRSAADAWALTGTKSCVFGTLGQETQFDDLVPLFNHFLVQREAQGGTEVQGPASVFLSVPAQDLPNELSESVLASDPRLSILRQIAEEENMGRKKDLAPASVTLLAAVKSRYESLGQDQDEQRCAIGTEIVAHILAELLFLPLEQINLEDDITKTGIDSLVATEFRSRIQQYFGKGFALHWLLSGGVSLKDLASDVITKLRTA